MKKLMGLAAAVGIVAGVFIAKSVQPWGAHSHGGHQVHFECEACGAELRGFILRTVAPVRS